MNDLNFPFGQGRRVRSIATTALAGASVALLAGCGGHVGGVPGGGAGISGENLQFASVASDLKATVAGSAGPYEVLQVIQSSSAAAAARGLSRSPVFIDFLQLYMSAVVTTNKITLNYSPAADGKSTSGQVIITTADNKTFHATGHIGGSLAMTLDVTVVLTGTSGANTMNGSVSLDGQHISFTLKNLSADDSGNIGNAGEMDVDYQSLAQTAFTNLSGKATSDIAGNVKVTAAGQTLTGTGTINLVKGSLQLNVKAPGSSDPLTALLVAKLNSEISFTDGKTINVDDILHFDLSKLTGSTGGLPTGSGGNNGYNAPVAIGIPSSTTSAYVWQAIPNGQMVGQATMSGTGATEAVYWDSPTGAATALPVPVGTTRSAAYGIANTGSKRMIVGSYTLDDGYNHPCVWTSTSASGSTNFAAPTTLPTDTSLYAHGGVARGISPDGTRIVGNAARNDVDVPVVFTSSRVFELPMGPLAGTPYEATGVTNNGTVLAVQSLQYNPEVWLNVKISGSSITASRQDLLNTTGSNMPSTEAFHMGPDGTVAGAQTDGKALYWDNGGYDAHALSVTDDRPAVAYAASADGKKFAGLLNPSGSGIDLAYWSAATTPATDVSTTLPASDFTQIGADFILADGSFIAIAQKSGSTSITFVYIKKK